MKSILVVEDEFEVAQAVAAILSDEGYEVWCCSDGLQAKALLQYRVPDLILTDVMMPYLNGYQLLRFIREQNLLSHIPVVLMSAASPTESEIEGNLFLKKPFDLDTLIVAVEKTMPRS